MKKLLTLFFCIILYNFSYSQSLTEKYNTFTKQYEYYNSSNQLVGYKKYNSLLNQWEYYDAQQTTAYKPPVDENFELQARVAIAKDQKYTENKKRLQDAINNIFTQVRSTNYPEEIRTSAIASFTVEYLDVLNSKSYDLSSDQMTDNIINWLNTGIQDIMSKEISAAEKANANKSKERDQNISELNYYSGGYTTTEVIEEKYNPFTKQYEFVKKDNTVSKIYIENGKIFYFRNQIGRWKLIPWVYSYSDTKNHTLNDTVGYTLITVDKKLGQVVFLENPAGGVFANRFTYKNLKKDNTITKPF